MRKVFKIYPALFILTPNCLNEPVLTNDKLRSTKFNSDSKDICFRNGLPQKYRGQCIVNDDRSVVFFRFSDAIVPCSFNSRLPESFFTELQPVTLIGQQYSLTYLCVNN